MHITKAATNLFGRVENVNFFGQEIPKKTYELQLFYNIYKTRNYIYTEFVKMAATYSSFIFI